MKKMTAKNDITGDNIVVGSFGNKYADNYDAIFRKQIEELDKAALDLEDDKVGHQRIEDVELFEDLILQKK